MVGVEKIPEACMRWNTNEEILMYLSIANINQQAVKKKTINRPKNGAMLFYDRTKVRYRADGYEWKKRKDGKNVREDHMKLKVNGIECLYGSYVHSEPVPNFHRRSYFKLKTPKIVLVHYLYVASEIVSPPSSSQLQTAIGQLTNIFNVSEYELVQAIKGSQYIDEFEVSRQGYLKAVAEQLFPARSDVQPSPPSNHETLVVLDQSEPDNTVRPAIKETRVKQVSEDKNTQTDIRELVLPCSSTTPLQQLSQASQQHSPQLRQLPQPRQLPQQPSQSNQQSYYNNNNAINNINNNIAINNNTNNIAINNNTNNIAIKPHPRNGVNKNHSQDMKELLVGVNNPILGSNIAPLPVNTMLPDNDMFSANLQLPYNTSRSPHQSDQCRNFLDNFLSDTDSDFDPPLKPKDSKLFELDSLLFSSPPLSPQLDNDPTLRLPDVTNSRPGEELLRICDSDKDSHLYSSLASKDSNLYKSDSTMSLDTLSSTSTFFDQFSQEGQHVSVTDDNNENVVSLRNESTAEDTVPARPVRINAVSPDWAFTSGGEKILIVGEWGDLSTQHCIVLFGTTPVAAQTVQSGVIRVICPPAPHPGLVNINLAVNNVILTDTAARFTYREQYCPSQWLNVGDNFKHSLVNRLQMLESQVQLLTQQQYSGDCQTRMCRVAQHILGNLSHGLPVPPPARGLRLIHLAAGLGYTRLVMTLLEFSSHEECSPSTLDEMGNNSVVWACVKGNVNVINLLLSHSPHLSQTTDGWGRSLRLVYTQHRGVSHRVRKRGDKPGDEKAAKIIQVYYRTYKEKKKNAAATRIQSRFRTYKQQCNFEQMRKAVVIIQQNYRCHMKQKEVAAKTIQRCWRQVRRPLSLQGNNLPYY